MSYNCRSLGQGGDPRLSGDALVPGLNRNVCSSDSPEPELPSPMSRSDAGIGEGSADRPVDDGP
eukprot:15228585-Heterocapsa_arctica.AAC.1